MLSEAWSVSQSITASQVQAFWVELTTLSMIWHCVHIQFLVCKTFCKLQWIPMRFFVVWMELMRILWLIQTFMLEVILTNCTHLQKCKNIKGKYCWWVGMFFLLKHNQIKVPRATQVRRLLGEFAWAHTDVLNGKRPWKQPQFMKVLLVFK